jgi:cytoskeletal protein RodZ
MLGQMRRILGLGVAWLGATVLSVLIASAAVAGIRDRVVETPEAIGAPTTTTVAVPTGATTSSSAPATTSTSTSTTAAPTTEPPETTVTTIVESGTSTTTTTAPPETTTTTTAPPTLTRKTYSLVGGTVVIDIGDGGVWVVSAVPNSGFYSEVDNKGPDEVKVEFEGNDHKSTFKAYFEDGELKVSKDEGGEGDDGGDDGGGDGGDGDGDDDD